MEAEIKKETDDGFGLLIHDNNGAEHKIGVCYDGKIDGHLCPAYADDPRDRTPDENEYNEQARRYARYYVYKKRGYDTVDHAENPEYVDAVRRAIADLSDQTFEEYFGALHRQLRSHDDPSVTQLVDLPTGVRSENAVIYELDVYLGIDLQDDALAEQAAAPATDHGLDVENASGVPSPVSVSERDLAAWQAVGDDLTNAADAEEIRQALDIAAVSGIHVGYPDRNGEHQVQRAEDPLPREPNTTIELMPYAPETIEEFREYLDHHLRCQVRDCYAGMGLLAPEPFRIRGFGKFVYARRYDHYSIYPPMHKSDPDHDRALI